MGLYGNSECDFILSDIAGDRLDIGRRWRLREKSPTRGRLEDAVHLLRLRNGMDFDAEKFIAGWTRVDKEALALRRFVR